LITIRVDDLRSPVSAKTPKYCPHYMYFFLVIAITELRYTALTLTHEYRERFPLTSKKKNLTRNWTQNLQHADLLLCYWAIVAHRQTVPKRIHKQL